MIINIGDRVRVESVRAGARHGHRGRPVEGVVVAFRHQPPGVRVRLDPPVDGEVECTACMDDVSLVPG